MPRLAVDTTDLLSKADYVPPPFDVLADNYRLLVALEILFVAGTLFFLFAQRKQKETLRVKPPQKPSRLPLPERRWAKVRAWGLHQVKCLWYLLTVYSNGWRMTHGFLLFWMCFFVLICFFLLPMNYAHLLIYKSFPVVQVHFASDVSSEIKANPDLLLLRRDKENFLFYVQRPTKDSKKQSQGKDKPLKEIWFVNAKEIKDLRVLANRSIWESTTQTTLTPLQPRPRLK